MPNLFKIIRLVLITAALALVVSAPPAAASNYGPGRPAPPKPGGSNPGGEGGDDGRIGNNICGAGAGGGSGANTGCIEFSLPFGVPLEPEMAVPVIWFERERPTPVVFSRQVLRYSAAHASYIFRVETDPG